MLNNKLKIVLAATGISIIGLTGISQASFIQPAIQNPVAVLQQQTQAVKADVGDGDGENNDDADGHILSTENN